MINRYGTTRDMIIQNVEENGAVHLLAIDAKGLYLTSEFRVDTRQADPNRYSAIRNEVPKRLEALGLSPAELFEQNKHLIKSLEAESKKKVNPLKASKRKR